MRRNRDYVEKRQQIIFYRNWLRSAVMLPEEELGVLIKSIVGYVETGEKPQEIEQCNNLAVKMCFENFTVADDANFKKFVARCETNKKNRNAQNTEDTPNDSDMT